MKDNVNSATLEIEKTTNFILNPINSPTDFHEINPVIQSLVFSIKFNLK